MVRRRAPVNMLRRVLRLVLVSLLMGACARPVLHLYPGPALSLEQVATLGATDTIVVLEMDGEPLPQEASHRTMAVSPGRHEVRFGYAHEICYYTQVRQGRECKRFEVGQTALGFAAVAGHGYWIHAAATRTGWKPYILDTTDGVVVAVSEREMPRNPRILFFLE